MTEYVLSCFIFIPIAGTIIAFWYRAALYCIKQGRRIGGKLERLQAAANAALSEQE